MAFNIDPIRDVIERIELKKKKQMEAVRAMFSRSNMNSIGRTTNADAVLQLAGIPSQEESSQILQLQRDKASLENEARELQNELLSAQTTGEEQKCLAENLQKKLEQIQRQQAMSQLYNSVCEEAQAELMKSGGRLDPLTKTPHKVPAFVMSVDIRRSTELMLNAVSDDHFAKFMTALCADLMTKVKRNYGIVEKFTGDGILCFFREDFSGRDFGYSAIKAAHECHQSFMHIYEDHEDCFSPVSLEAGLGIGLDFGGVTITATLGGLTIIGKPVVFACRMGAAHKGETWLNRPAYSFLKEKYDDQMDFEETEVVIKNAGRTKAFKTTLRSHMTAQLPEWLTPVAPPTQQNAIPGIPPKK